MDQLNSTCFLLIQSNTYVIVNKMSLFFSSERIRWVEAINPPLSKKVEKLFMKLGVIKCYQTRKFNYLCC